VAAGVFAVGIGMVGPTLIAHGTEEQKARYLDPLLRGDEVWCQLFSEPGAGSDLAGLSTKAVRDGDEFVVDGQKVWTSGAQHSQLGILLARTDPDVPKHRGITYFVVDMATPGIEVRPLRQINGAAHFNEVFLSGVRIPATDVVGEVDGGWGVALTTLGSERSLIGGGMGGTAWPQLLELARAHGATADPLRRQEIAAAFTRYEVLRFLGYRVQTALSQHRLPGAEASVLKLAYSRHTAATADLAMTLTGATGTLLGGEDLDEAWRQQFLGQWSSRIGGGTDQIQGNVIAERVLGLPRDARPDKDVPFRELARPAR
jgi:alkylation response protein AidB-like acyl-CoA dehydrogenase